MGKAAGSATALFLPDENKPFYNFASLRREAQADFAVKKFQRLEHIVKGHKSTSR